MTVSEFVKYEKSGAMFILIDARKTGYMSTEEAMITADRNAVSNIYGDADVVGFEPKGKKVRLYVLPKES